MPDRVMPFGFVLLWSSSFIAARVGLRHISPLLFITARMAVCAVALLVLMVALRRSWRPLKGVWVHCAVAGILVHGLMLSTAHVAMTRITAAPIALIQTLNPLLTAVFAWPVLGEKLTTVQGLGLLLGTAGVALVVGGAALHSVVEADAMLLSAVGIVGLAAGTLYFGRFCRGVPMLEGATVQFLASTIACGLATWVLETPSFDPVPGAYAATLWNAIVVSLGGMALYLLMLTRGTAARATANFYLMPGTASVMAWLLLREPLQALTVGGLIISSAGCWLVRRRS